MKKNILFIVGITILVFSGCGENKEASPTDVDFSEIAMVEESETIPVIIRDELPEETQSLAETEIIEEGTDIESETKITALVDRGKEVVYKLEAALYEEGEIKVHYPQLNDMSDADLQKKINENIRTAVLMGVDVSNLNSFELDYEIASAGKNVVSIVFRGSSYQKDSAYPVNIAKTLNIDLNTGDNLRLKDYSDIGAIVAGLENGEGYNIKNEGVSVEDFSGFLNSGYLTDYALTLLDFDLDFNNPKLVVSGYSAIQDNKLILFMEAEHGMGDYVELEFEGDL